MRTEGDTVDGAGASAIVWTADGGRVEGDKLPDFAGNGLTVAGGPPGATFPKHSVSGHGLVWVDMWSVPTFGENTWEANKFSSEVYGVPLP